MNRLLIGSRVRNTCTGQIGTIELWWPNRIKAVLMVDNELTDWIPTKYLEIVN